MGAGEAAEGLEGLRHARQQRRVERPPQRVRGDLGGTQGGAWRKVRSPRTRRAGSLYLKGSLTDFAQKCS